MRWVAGVLVARPLESQGEEAAIGRSNVGIVVVGTRRTGLGGCLRVLPQPSLCADGEMLLNGLTGRTPGVGLPDSSGVLTFEVAFVVRADVVRTRENNLSVYKLEESVEHVLEREHDALACESGLDLSLLANPPACADAVCGRQSSAFFQGPVGAEAPALFEGLDHSPHTSAPVPPRLGSAPRGALSSLVLFASRY